ncbi:hypothetical protein MLD38_003099 [Melastoma candidum]|uniref:Uncharacterized protein n=1 Tax=Melastoma candidum TaxID=119954 RepID=A0ACB9SA30_9MYRT|nr:hypothetical protein MLD38_003099 [Melastoma candidum]
MAADGEPKSNEDAEENTPLMIIDPIYEFSAPRFYDFIDGETQKEERTAELWFDGALSHGPSPYMSRVKTGRRSIKVELLCDFSEAEPTHEEMEPDGTTDCSEGKLKSEPTAGTNREALESKSSHVGQPGNHVSVPEEPGKIDGPDAGSGVSDHKTKQLEVPSSEKVSVGPPHEGVGVHTPKPQVSSKELASRSMKNRTAQKIAGLIKNPSALKNKNPVQSSQAKCKTMLKTEMAKRDLNNKDASSTLNLAQENQAIKRQKLDGGKSRLILNVKPQVLPRKWKLGLSSDKSGLCSSAASSKIRKEDRKMYIREPTAPFISAAEMIKKFQSSTRDLSLPFSSVSHGKPKLTLTRPKEPEFETAQRIRLVKVKSTAEIEEEMMAKIPKFKARPLNKKILDAPTLSAPQRSVPKPPEFQEFRLKTMERANSNAESGASIAPSEMTHHQANEWKPHLTEPRAPTLLTSLRARPSAVKTSVEVEQEELEKAPKFKARPLNKKIFESKGNLGMFCNAKKLVTIPQEFHFATDERFPPPAAMCDMFDKLSLKSNPQLENPLPKKTPAIPFHLHTEERGAEKERKFRTELTQKQLEEERTRIPKASPYPYTTDFPVVPPKPEPKQCTKPEPFQLESLVRHEEELHKEVEERERMEREEAEMRIFKAQPILKEDPISIPEKVRRPLTQVQEFSLQSDHRAVDRAEYDHKIKEKEAEYKRHREEIEAAKVMEEEKALKRLRRTLVHHSKPVPNFSHPFHPQKSLKETTRAKSPKLRVLRRKQENQATAAHFGGSSAAATNMR